MFKSRQDELYPASFTIDDNLAILYGGRFGAHSGNKTNRTSESLFNCTILTSVSFCVEGFDNFCISSNTRKADSMIINRHQIDKCPNFSCNRFMCLQGE